VKALLATLTAAATPYVGADHALELARNLVTPIADPEENVAQAVQCALDARMRPRVGGWQLTPEQYAGPLFDALVDAGETWWADQDRDDGGEESEDDECDWQVASFERESIDGRLW